MKKDGLQRMLDFLAMLNEKGIHFQIEQQSPEGLMVTLTLVGARVEVEFFVDEMHYCVFSGSESVDTDEGALMRVIAEKWAD